MVDASGKVKYSLQTVTNQTCNNDFIKKHKLTLESTPSDWICPFFPAKKPKGSGKDEFNTNQWTTFTNMKAEMEFGGDKSARGVYDKFERFTPGGIRRHLLLYSIQGLSPSPQLHMKMKDQIEEPFQGCDEIAN